MSSYIKLYLFHRDDLYIVKNDINQFHYRTLDLVIKKFMSGYKKIFDMLRILSIIGNIERESVDFKEVQRWSSVRCFGNFFTNISDIFAGFGSTFFDGGLKWSSGKCSGSFSTNISEKNGKCRK